MYRLKAARAEYPLLVSQGLFSIGFVNWTFQWREENYSLSCHLTSLGAALFL
jgi:aryl carrier-like protein